MGDYLGLLLLGMLGVKTIAHVGVHKNDRTRGN